MEKNTDEGDIKVNGTVYKVESYQCQKYLVDVSIYNGENDYFDYFDFDDLIRPSRHSSIQIDSESLEIRKVIDDAIPVDRIGMNLRRIIQM